MKTRMQVWCVAGLAALASAGCGDNNWPDGGKGDAGTRPVSYSQDIQPIWEERCISCHNTASPEGNLNLEASVSYAQIVNVSSTHPGCASIRRVLPGDRQASLLWRSLANASSCVGPMPQGTAGLIAFDRTLFDKVQAWIDAGAPNN